MKRTRTRFLGLFVGSCILAAACHEGAGQNGDAGPHAEPTAVPTRDGPTAGGADDEVRPVYPVDHAPVDPLAQRFCEAVHSVEEDRRAICCGERPGLVFTGECARTLGAALRSKAVTLDPADVDTCAAAVGVAYSGCDWTGPHPPPLPEACGGVVHGTLSVGAVCRIHPRVCRGPALPRRGPDESRDVVLHPMPARTRAAARWTRS